MESFLTANRVRVGLTDATLTPQVRIGRPPLAYGHGAANDPGELVGFHLPAVMPLVAATVENGLAAGCVMTAQLWHNPEYVARTDELVAFLRSAYGSSAADPAMFGTSMNGGSSVVYAHQRPVACAVLVMPAFDTDYIRDNDVGNARIHIEDAWNIGSSDPLPAGANPILAPAPCPIQMWVPSNDPFGTNAADWASDNAGLVEFHDLGPVGHSPEAVAAIDRAVVAAFVEAHT